MIGERGFGRGDRSGKLLRDEDEGMGDKGKKETVRYKAERVGGYDTL